MPAGLYKRTEEIREKQSKKMKGKHWKLSEITKKKMSKNNVRYWKGKKLSEETKKKMSKKRRKRINENAPGWRGGKIKRICKICNKEFMVIPSRIKNGQGKFCSRKCSGISIVKHMKKKDTSIELLMEQELIKNKIPYMKQVPIEGIALVDFLLPNKIIIQCDGIYWHRKELNKGKDIAQDTILSFKGYKIFRFTDLEINKSTAKCINKVLGR